MLAMNNEGFPLFKRTCSAQILSMACFPGLGPSVRHAPVCSSIKSWLSAGPTSPREKALFLYAEMTANLPHTRKLLHSPRHPLLAYSEVTLPGLSAGPGGRGEGGAPPLGAQEVPPEWVSNCVYLLLAVLQEYIYSISCLSLLLTRDLFRVLPRTARCW